MKYVLAALGAASFVAMFVIGHHHEFTADVLFVLAAFFGILAYAAHQRFERKHVRISMAIVFLVFPLIALGGAFDLPETIDPIKYWNEGEYRGEVHERWRESKLRFAGDVFGLLLALALAGGLIAFWAAVVYLVFHLIRHGALPSWA